MFSFWLYMVFGEIKKVLDQDINTTGSSDQCSAFFKAPVCGTTVLRNEKILLYDIRMSSSFWSKQEPLFLKVKVSCDQNHVYACEMTAQKTLEPKTDIFKAKTEIFQAKYVL